MERIPALRRCHAGFKLGNFVFDFMDLGDKVSTCLHDPRLLFENGGFKPTNKVEVHHSRFVRTPNNILKLLFQNLDLTVEQLDVRVVVSMAQE